MLQVFESWNKGELDSFLIEITKDILKFKDSDGGSSALCYRQSTVQILYAQHVWLH
jgi:6-phosphogluconate dehydrogenase